VFHGYIFFVLGLALIIFFECVFFPFLFRSLFFLSFLFPGFVFPFFRLWQNRKVSPAFSAFC